MYTYKVCIHACMYVYFDTYYTALATLVYCIILLALMATVLLTLMPL